MVKSLLKTLQSLSQNFRVSYEATGSYPRHLITTCLENEVPVSLLNSRQVRDYAKACGQLAKTDKIDTKLIAKYSETFEP